MGERGNTRWCIFCGLCDTNGQHGELCATCAASLQLLDGLMSEAREASIITPEASPSNTLVGTSDRQQIPLVVAVVDYIPLQAQDLRVRALSPFEFRNNTHDHASPVLDFREAHSEPADADDIPSEEDLVEMIVELFLSSLSRPSQVCNATIDSIPRTNLNLDHSKLYRAALQIEGREQLTAIVIDPGPQPLPFYADMPLVGLGSSNSTTIEHGRIRSFVERQALVVLERWRGISDRTIEILRSSSVGGIILIDDADAASCIEQYTNAGYPRFLPVIVVKEYVGEALLHLSKAEPSGLVCKLTVEATVERDCAICFERMDMVMHFPKCGHIIHETCGVKWLSSQNSCPYCRQDLTDIHHRRNNKVTTSHEHSIAP